MEAITAITALMLIKSNSNNGYDLSQDKHFSPTEQQPPAKTNDADCTCSPVKT